MKILYLTYDGLSDPLGQSQVIPYIVGLSKRGHKIVVLSSEKKAPAELLATIGRTWKNIKLNGIQLLIRSALRCFQLSTTS